MEARRFHPLPREVTVDRFSMNSEHTADPHRIQSPAVNQPPDRFRMHAELIRNLANADEPRVYVSRRHGRLRRLARSSLKGNLVASSDPAPGAPRSERLVIGATACRGGVRVKATSKARTPSL